MEKSKNQPRDEQAQQPAARESGAASGPIGTSVDWEIPGDVPETHRRSVSAYAAVDDPGRHRGHVPLQSGDTPKRRTSPVLRALGMLLLMLGLGGVGYMYTWDGHEAPLATNAGQAGANDVAVIEDVPTLMQAMLSNVAEAAPVVPQRDTQPVLADNVMKPAEAGPAPRIITHVVKKGDTLWDIAGHYVDDPFRYPELAELSKIDNPDLIYPGDIVRIRL